MSLKLRSEKNCLNCGSEVTDHFCPHCGQANTEPRESFRHIMTHFITDYLHLDEKFFSSLKFLFLKPGFLTNEYNLGRRTTYVHPFRLYIFITIVFFIVQSTGNHVKTPKKLADVVDSTNLDSAEVEEFGNIKLEYNEPETLTEDSTVEQYLTRQELLPDSAKDSYIQSFFRKKEILAKQQDFNLNEKIMENFKHNIPKMMFLMLPLYALILYVLFRKKRLFYVEHFYHAVFLHSFFYIIKLLFIFPERLLPETYDVYLNSIFLIILGTYLYKSLRVVYDENGVSTLFKLIISIVFYFIFLLILVLLNGLVSFLLL